jgi:hypothetical protein
MIFISPLFLMPGRPDSSLDGAGREAAAVGAQNPKWPTADTVLPLFIFFSLHLGPEKIALTIERLFYMVEP